MIIRENSRKEFVLILIKWDTKENRTNSETGRYLNFRKFRPGKLVIYLSWYLLDGVDKLEDTVEFTERLREDSFRGRNELNDNFSIRLQTSPKMDAGERIHLSMRTIMSCDSSFVPLSEYLKHSWTLDELGFLFFYWRHTPFSWKFLKPLRRINLRPLLRSRMIIKLFIHLNKQFIHFILLIHLNKQLMIFLNIQY